MNCHLCIVLYLPTAFFWGSLVINTIFSLSVSVHLCLKYEVRAPSLGEKGPEGRAGVHLWPAIQFTNTLSHWQVLLSCSYIQMVMNEGVFLHFFFSFIKICKKKKWLVMIYVSLKGTSHSLFRRSSCNMFGSQLWFTEPLPWKALPPIQGVSFQVQTRASWQPGPGRPRGIAVSLPGCPCAGAHPHLPAFNFLRLWWWNDWRGVGSGLQLT